MRRFQKPLVPISVVAVVVLGIIGFACRFSFAEGKRPDKGSVTFGAAEKPDVKIAAEMQGFKTVFADIAAKVIPTVVSVIPTKIDTVVFYNNPFYRYFDEDPFGGEGSPFDFFFGQQQQQQPQQQPRGRQRNQQQMEKKELRRSGGLGSGVIVSKDGYILTNNHVVAGADEIQVKTSDGRTFDAEIMGTDSLTDVAVIKIKDKVSNLPVAYLGDSDKLRPGDWAMAVGNPFSLTSTVTVGIVSALGRTNVRNDQATYQNYIQTDAAINPGNSGGALVNIDGELIGINTMIITPSGAFAGIGLAIPINMAKWIMEDLIYEGQVKRGWLGIKMQPLNQQTRDAMGLEATVQGVLVAAVLKGQPAEKAGVKSGDIIVSIDGHPVKEPNELALAVAGINPGKKVPLGVLRNGKSLSLNVQLVLREEDKISKMDKASGAAAEEGKSSADSYERFGIKVGNITDASRKEYGIETGVTGVVITDVDRVSDAAQDLQPGDVITAVKVRGADQTVVTTVDEFKRIAKGVKEGESIMFLVNRQGQTFFVAFKVRK
jgi:Do/DeqQ family serine protease